MGTRAMSTLKIVSFWVLLSLVLKVHVVPTSSSKVLFRRKNGLYLANSVARTENTENEFECAAVCSNDEICSSANYKNSGNNQGTCQLNNRSLDESPEKDHVLKKEFTYLGLIKPFSQCNGRPSSGGEISKEIKGCSIEGGKICQCHLNNANISSGTYEMLFNATLVSVYCDQTTDNGGWLVIQRNNHGDGSFYKTWDEYKNGFGDLNGNFWWGNEKTHNLTWSANYELRVDMKLNDGNKVFVKYTGFKLSNENDGYRLHLDNSGIDGTTPDKLFSPGFYKHQSVDRKFTTKDKDNDDCSCNCASSHSYNSGWWFGNCNRVNLNKPVIQWQGLNVQQAEMKIRLMP